MTTYPTSFSKIHTITGQVRLTKKPMTPPNHFKLGRSKKIIEGKSPKNKKIGDQVNYVPIISFFGHVYVQKFECLYILDVNMSKK